MYHTSDMIARKQQPERVAELLDEHRIRTTLTRASDEF
jgi:hypothetical protein